MSYRLTNGQYSGADSQNRTDNLWFTIPLLCLLSYISIKLHNLLSGRLETLHLFKTRPAGVIASCSILRQGLELRRMNRINHT